VTSPARPPRLSWRRAQLAQVDRHRAGRDGWEFGDRAGLAGLRGFDRRVDQRPATVRAVSDLLGRAGGALGEVDDVGAHPAAVHAARPRLWRL
jgi:hypothetical protein